MEARVDGAQGDDYGPCLQPSKSSATIDLYCGYVEVSSYTVIGFLST